MTTLQNQTLQARTLQALFPEMAPSAPTAGLPVAGITADSRAVEPGFVFVAVPGTKADGFSFVPQAIARGASAVVTEGHAALPDLSVPVLVVADARVALSQAAARFFPGQPATIVAVTGTSGKTSVAAFVRQIWLALGHAAASLGTIGLVRPSGAVYGSLTTPDPVSLHRTLDELAREGVTHLAMEASSHGLDQRRLDGVRLCAGAFTNLSRDHLDYHPDEHAYLAAKLRLFEVLLQPGQTAVYDTDSTVAATVAGACAARGLRTCGVGYGGDGIRLVAAVREGFSTRLTLEHPEQSQAEQRHSAQRHSVILPLLGGFQVANALVAAGLCIATGGAADAVLRALETLQGAPGRLERVGAKGDAPVFVDYAHKPDALEKALQALRPLTAGRLVVVFGAGGDRDAGKRPIMGAIASQNADVVIVTDDNPRSEKPAAIRAAILAQAPGALEIGPRGEAIAHAVAMLEPGDALLIAGKGHETGQIVGDETLPFSDHEAVLLALRKVCA